jgi:hypothetical protein
VSFLSRKCRLNLETLYQVRSKCMDLLCGGKYSRSALLGRITISKRMSLRLSSIIVEFQTAVYKNPERNGRVFWRAVQVTFYFQ